MSLAGFALGTIALATIALGTIALGSCADFSRGAPSAPLGDAGVGSEGGGGDAVVTDGATLSFATVVYPLLNPTCQRCHSAGQQAGDTQLLFAGSAATDYPTVVMFVNTSVPASSRLLSKMSGNGHGGGTVYAAGSTEYQTILQWIQGGAQP